MRLGGIYAHACVRRPPPDYGRRHWIVCTRCLPDFVPRCFMCRAPAPVAYEIDGFRAYTWGKLCPACVARVQSAGPWRQRRAHANQARATALLSRWPELTSQLRARTTHVEGLADGRAVHVKLRQAAREWHSERFIFLVAFDGPAERVTVQSLGLEERLTALLARDSVKVIHDHGRWLRAAFAHLGKLDTVTVLERLLEAAPALEK